MVKCSAKYCSAETSNTATFFRFPSSSFATRRSIWVKNTGAEILPSDNECYLCPKHFGPDQFRNRSLRWDAVPTLYHVTDTNNHIESQQEQVKDKKRKRKCKPTPIRRERDDEDSNDSLFALEIVDPPVEKSPLKLKLVLKQNSHPKIVSPIQSRSPTPEPIMRLPPQPPPPEDNGIVDFEEEIDRLNDPLRKEKPVLKRKDEDVRTRFTEEDDIPIKKLFLGTKKVNPFNTNLPLPPLPQRSQIDIYVEEPDEPESILGDTPSYEVVEAPQIQENGNDATVMEDVKVSLKIPDRPLQNTTVSECFSLCSHCDYYAPSEEKLLEHEMSAHSSKTKQVNSKVYPFKILTKSDGGQFYLCDFCNYSGKTMSSLVAHMVEHFPKENEKGLSIQKYCATIAVSGKNTKDVVTVSMNNGVEKANPDIVEIPDDDVFEVKDNLNDIVISNVAGGHEVKKLFAKSKRKTPKTPQRRSLRRK